MTYPEFQKFVGNLCDYFDRGTRIPKANAIRLWYEQLSHIPAKDLKPIFRQLAQASWPSNLPADVKRAWSGSARTEKEAEASGCPECERGVLFMKRREDFGYYGKYAFRCGRCRTSNLSGLPEGTARDLVAQGWLYDASCEFEPDERDGMWREDNA